ncbi:hypothetical protein FRB94_014356 [Tulasnella sp. JGI-2019a]|nr:hypothetical protein FRB94_014356 [Tulasnella sp. JGI-2019a]
MNSPGDVKIKQAIATLLEAVQEVCSSTSMSGEQDPLNEIAAFDTCLDRFTTKMYQIIANRRRGYNANLPIHQLPPELMTRILAAEAPPSLFKYSGIGYIQRLQELASVSSSWAQLIKDTPSFWANVSNKLSPYHLRQILSRSRSCLLDVEFVHMAPKGTPLNVFIPLVSEHVCRWRSVEINEDSSDGVIRTLRFVQASALETLCVTLCSDGPYDLLAPVETILCGKTDRLRNVNLGRFCIPWDSGILRGLISLKLGYFGKNGPMVDQLLNILSASPELTTLHLYVLEAGGTSHRAGLLELPALRTLRISQLCPPLERALLSAIRFHGHTNFSLTTDLDVTGFLQDPSIADFVSFFRSSLFSSEDLTVTHHSTAI